MALLNPPQILPNVAGAIYRYLLQAEGHRERRSTFVAMLAPASLEQNAGGAGSPALDLTLRACEQIRLVKSEGDDVKLHPDLPAYALDRRTGARALRRLLRELVMAPDLNAGEWGSQEGARDLCYSLAWYLRQDIYSAPGVWDLHPPLQSAQLVQQEQLAGPPLLVNGERWLPFARWATYLGLAVHQAYDGTAYLVPDPTVAIRETLSVCCPGPRGEVELPELLRRLGEQLPVIDGGTYRQEVDRHLRPGSYAAEEQGTVSTALGHALRRLEDAEVIVLSDRADADRVIFASELGQRVVRSHISWAKRVQPAEGAE
jgi:hypothetical protein